MNTPEKIKKEVRKKYAEIALAGTETTGCCGSDCGCETVDYSIFSADYADSEGYLKEADLGLGCGLPVAHARIKTGDTVLDLGSGAGNDCFTARAQTGETGRVIGVDMTPEMIEKARINTEKVGFKNVEHRLGEIEQLPVADNEIDVIVSNCVLNLVPEKERAFAEMFRVLRPGGHFSVSDVVLKGELPVKIRENAEMYAGCVSGASQRETYLKMLADAGFADIEIQKENTVKLPDEMVLQFLNEAEFANYKKGEIGVFSITVYGKKPA